MASQPITLPDCLKNWIDNNVIGLWRFNLVCTNGDFPVPDGYGGITLFNTVYLRNCAFDPCNREDVRLLFHELIHIKQEQVLLYIPFFIFYGLGWLVTGASYHRNPFEAYARARANELVTQYFADDPCGCLTPPPPVTVPTPPTPSTGSTPPPTGTPRQLTPEEISHCCEAGQDNLSIGHSTVTAPGANRTVSYTIWAQSKCGVNSLTATVTFIRPGAGTSTAGPREFGNGHCMSFIRGTDSQVVVSGGTVVVTVEARSCCGNVQKIAFNL